LLKNNNASIVIILCKLINENTVAKMFSILNSLELNLKTCRIQFCEDAMILHVAYFYSLNLKDWHNFDV